MSIGTRKRPLTLAEIAHNPEPPTANFGDVAKKPPVEFATRPEPVLVVVNGDWLEVYGSKGIHLHVVQKPYMGTSSSVEAELMAESYVDAKLPFRYRQLYVPGFLRWQGPIERITPQQRLATHASH